MIKKLFAKNTNTNLTSLGAFAKISIDDDCETVEEDNPHRAPCKDMSSIFATTLAVNALFHYEPSYQFDEIIHAFIDGDRLENSVVRTTKLLSRYYEEYNRKKQEKAYLHVIIRDHVSPADVADFATALREYYEVEEDLPLHHNISILKELLDLTDTELKVLNLSMHYSELNEVKGMEYNSRALFHKTTSLDRYKKPENVLADLLMLSPDEVTKIIKGVLRKAAIITPRDNVGFYGLNHQLRDVFLSTSLSASYIEEQLFPSLIDNNLKITDFPHLQKEFNRSMDIVDRNLETKRAGTNIMLWGPPGTGKSLAALSMAEARGWNLRVIGDVSADDDTEKSRAARIASLKLAQKILASDPKAVLLFDEMEDIFKEDKDAAFSKAFINRIIETTPVPIIWTTNSLQALEHSVMRRMVYNVEMNNPPKDTRKIIWTKYCGETGLNLSEQCIEKLANTYEIAPAIIRNAVNVAYAVVGSDTGEAIEKEVIEIVENMGKLVNLGASVSKDEEMKGDDNPYNTKWINSPTNLDELTDDVIASNPRWSLCLYGAPGVGKSNFAKELAKKMGKKIVKKRASDIQSAWVGEMEKNLANEFRKAKEGKYILLIDEGDTFLQDRTMAKQSWEISQVNEMLSQMEDHTEPFILTTNLMDNIDAAALRRFTFKLKFDYLRPEQAVEIFKEYFKVDPPVSILKNEILAPGDFANVKRQCDIRNITDANKIYALLKAETDLKPNFSKSIGF